MRFHKTLIVTASLVSLATAGSINSTDYDNGSSSSRSGKVEDRDTVYIVDTVEVTRSDNGADKGRYESNNTVIASTESSPSDPTHGIKIYMGYRTLAADAESFFFRIYDESPQPDSLTTLGEFEGTGAFAFGVGIESAPTSPFHREYVGEFQYGDYKLFSFQIGLGYNFELVNNLYVRPKINVGYARTILDLGELENSARFFEFDDELFEDEAMDVELKGHNWLATPSVDIVFDVDESWYLTLNAGYQYAMQFGTPYIEVTSRTDDDESARVGLDNSNVTYNVDGINVEEELPFNPEGLSVGVAVSIKF